MITKYRIETWDPKSNRYHPCWYGDSFKMAEAMFNKPYYVYHTRRLIKTTEEELYKAKGEK